MTPRAVSTRARPFATVTLEIACPLQYEDASQYEGKVWRECRCELEVEIDYSCYLGGKEWRVGRAPEGCPLQPPVLYTDSERAELGKRIVDAFDRWTDNQEIR